MKRWLWLLLLLLVPAFLGHRMYKHRRDGIFLRDTTIKAIQDVVAEVKAGKPYYADDYLNAEAACGTNFKFKVDQDIIDAINAECAKDLPFLKEHAKPGRRPFE